MLSTSYRMAADPKELEEMKTILMTNLQILGMDVVAMAEIHKIPFNIDMFNLPNKAGSEVVLYFLFSKLNPSVCKEQFRDCWPVLDRKSELQFRKVCTHWLTNIQKGDVESHLPHVNAALLLSPGGRKFTHLLYSFSIYVLVQVMKSDYGWEAQNSIIYPVINQRNEALNGVASSAIQDSLLRERNKFFEYGHLTVIANRQWKDYTNDLVKEFRGLTKANRDLELDKKQKVNLLIDSCIKQDLSLPAKRTTTMFDSDQNSFAIRLEQRMKRAMSHWISLTKFSDFMSERREIFQSILGNATAKFAIDGTELGIRVPGLLLRECRREMQKREIDNIYNGGALNLVSLVQLWNICLNMYKEHFESETLPSVSSEVPLITAQAHKHHSHLKHTQELREKMQDHTLPNLRRSISKLQKKLNSQRISTTSTDKNTNRLGLILTAPTPPTTAVTRNSNSVRETPPGPVAGPVAHSGSTPDALQNMHSKIEMAVQKDAEASQVLMDAHALSRLMNIQQGYVSKKGTHVQISKTHLKEGHLKSVKPRDSTKGITAKSSHQLGLSKSIPVRNAAPHQTTQAYKQIPATPVVSVDYTTTPKTSKQIAVDFLADSIVDSVLNSTDSTVLSDMSVDTLLEFGDLGADAFESRSLIKRSPEKSSKSFQNLETWQASGAHQSRTDGLHNQTSVYNEKSLEASVHHESVFSQNSKDADSSFGSGIVELDWSNNASIGTASWLPKAHKSGSGKHSSHNSFNNKTGVFYSTGSLRETTAETVKSGVKTQLVDDLHTTSPEKTAPSLKKHSGERGNTFSGASSNDWNVFNILNSLDKSPVTHLESCQEQRSSSLHFEHSIVSSDLSLVNNSLTFETTNDNHDLFQKITKPPQNIHHSSSSLSQNRLTAEKTSCDVTPDMKSVHERTNGFDHQGIPYRQPGDGQASLVQTVQPVSAMSGGSDSDTDTEKTFDNSRLISLSPLKAESDSLLPSDLLTTSIYNRLKNVQSHEQSVVSAHPNVPHTKADIDSEIKLQSQQESELVSYSHGKSFNIEDFLNEQITQINLNPSVKDFSKASEDKLLDLGTKNVPVLVSLDSEDEDFESEQTHNDSYVPFKQGIHWDRSPAKHNLTPSRAVVQSLVRTDDPNLSNKTDPIPVSSSDDNCDKKLALLQRKALYILNSSFCEEQSPVEHDKFSMATTNPRSQEDAALINANSDEDDDILNTELISTDLLAGLEDIMTL